MLAFLVLTAVTFSLFGFIIGVWADGFEKLQIVPMLVRHAADLPRRHASTRSGCSREFWQTVTLFNPIVYLINGFRWSFYEVSDVNVGVSPHDDARLPLAVPPWPFGGSSRPAIG